MNGMNALMKFFMKSFNDASYVITQLSEMRSYPDNRFNVLHDINNTKMTTSFKVLKRDFHLVFAIDFYFFLMLLLLLLFFNVEQNGEKTRLIVCVCSAIIQRKKKYNTFWFENMLHFLVWL